MFPDGVFPSIVPGLSSNVVPMYLGELAPKNLRGALGVVPQLFITIGILVAQLFGLRSLLANEEGELQMPLGAGPFVLWLDVPVSRTLLPSRPAVLAWPPGAGVVSAQNGP